MLLSYNFKMDQISENKNLLFKRQELVFQTDTNLTFEEAKKEVASKVGKDESVIDVYNVKGGFGNTKFMVSANVYDNKEDLEIMKNMELSKKKKKAIEEAKVKAEEEAKAPVEEVKEEAAPVEEKTEEAVPAEEPAAEEEKVEEKKEEVKEEAKTE